MGKWVILFTIAVAQTTLCGTRARRAASRLAQPARLRNAARPAAGNPGFGGSDRVVRIDLASFPEGRLYMRNRMRTYMKVRCNYRPGALVFASSTLNRDEAVFGSNLGLPCCQRPGAL